MAFPLDSSVSSSPKEDREDTPTSRLPFSSLSVGSAGAEKGSNNTLGMGDALLGSDAGGGGEGATTLNPGPASPSLLFSAKGSNKTLGMGEELRFRLDVGEGLRPLVESEGLTIPPFWAVMPLLMVLAPVLLGVRGGFPVLLGEFWGLHATFARRR